MTSTVESESRLTAWESDTRLTSELKKAQLIRETLSAVREQINEARQESLDLEQQHVEERAHEIVAGSKNRERNDKLATALADSREKQKNLQFEEQSLIIAEKTVSASVKEIESRAKAEARQRILAAIQKQTRAMKALVMQAQSANDILIALDAELKWSGLAETGSKQIVLLSRTGASWNALSPTPIHGSPIHATDWIRHIDSILGE